MFLIYLDVCCFNRPFDEQTHERIHLEAEAVLLTHERCQSFKWRLLGSEAIDFEISQIPDEEREQKVTLLASLAASKVAVTEGVGRRAIELARLRFNTYDALHIACAEEGNADVLLTTDDRLLKKATRHKRALKVRVSNPIFWLLELTRDGSS